MPTGWAQHEAEGIPYYTDESGVAHWLHPTEVEKFAKNYAHIKFSIYRVVQKLRTVQKETRLDRVQLKSFIDAVNTTGPNEKAISIPQMRARLLDIIKPVVASPEEAVNRIIQILLAVYDRRHYCVVRIRDFKIAVSTLCNGSPREKFKFAGNVLDDDADRRITRAQLEMYINSLCKIVYTIGESVCMGISAEAVAREVSACFAEAEAKGQSLCDIDSMFVKWAMTESTLLAWVGILGRVAKAEDVPNEGYKCKVCAEKDFPGMMYRSLKLKGGVLCQKCVWEGKESGSHKVTHPIVEYCRKPTMQDNVKDFGKRLRPGKAATWRLRDDQAAAAPDVDKLLQVSTGVGAELAGDSAAGAMYDEETHALIAQFASRLRELEPTGDERARAPSKSVADVAGASVLAAEERDIAAYHSGHRRSVGTQTMLDVGVQADFLIAASATPIATAGTRTGSAGQELTAASREIDDMISQLQAMKNELGQGEGSSFGEQLLRAAQDMVEHTSLLVLMASAARKEEAKNLGRPDDADKAWTADVDSKASNVHQATQALVEAMQNDSKDQGSATDVLQSGEAVNTTSNALLAALKVSNETKDSAPEARDGVEEAEDTAAQAKARYEELLRLANSKVSQPEPLRGGDDGDDGGLHGDAYRKRRVRFTQQPPLMSEELPSYGPSNLRPISMSVGGMTIKRQSVKEKSMRDRWQYILFAIEEECHVDTGVAEEDVEKALPPALKDGVLVTKLVQAMLRHRGMTEEELSEFEPNMPEDGRALTTIRVMENVRSFEAGCRRLGLAPAQICNQYDIIEGKGSLEVVRCLEAVIAKGRGKPVA